MLHSKCLKCTERKADGILTLSVTKKGKKLKLYCKMCEQEILYELVSGLEGNGTLKEVTVMPKGKGYPSTKTSKPKPKK